MNKQHSLTVLFTSLTMALSMSCSAKSDEDWTASITQHLDSELVGEMKKITDPTTLKSFACRKGDFSKKVFSLRSFEGRLCEDTYVKGLKMVGGAALLMCWDDNIDGFQDSGCAERALKAYGMSKSTYSKDKIKTQMETLANDYVKKAESTSGASSNLFYLTAKTLFCLVPSTLLGPGATVHNIWCGQ